MASTGFVHVMPRARNIKPGFYKNEELARCSLLARFLFPGLWMLADRAGRLEDRPFRIKAELLPYDDANADALLSELHSAGFILRYEVDHNRYIQIVCFDKHQNPHKHEAASTIPAPCEHSTSTLQEQDKHPTTTEVARLIPDSLIPDCLRSTLSGKPDAEPLKSEKSKVNGSHPSVKAQAREVLGYLNRCTERNYQPVAVNLEMIEARLREGYTPLLMRRVISDRVNRWGSDDKMNEYLRPATLFNRQKFSQYAGEIPPE